MNHEQLFVGAVAIALGIGGLIGAIANWDPYYRLHKVRWIEKVGGRWCARLVYAVLGIGLIVLGVAIAMG
jgi:hypothetical protein